MKNQLITTALAALMLAACSSGVGKAPDYQGNVEGAENISEPAPAQAKEDEKASSSIGVKPGQPVETEILKPAEVTVGPQCKKYYGVCCPAMAKAASQPATPCTAAIDNLKKGTQASADQAEATCTKGIESASQGNYC